MLIDSKSQLAKLLATENLIVEQQNVPTAFFELKNRRLVIPILDNNLSAYLYDLMIGHEVGHALNTPMEGWHDSVVDLNIPRSVLNVVEDARIEKLIKRKYPGLRMSFTKAYHELMERDFFNIKGVDCNKLNLIDRLNLHFKVGASLGIRFTEEEQVFVNEMEQLETWEDVVAVSSKILARMKEEAKERRENRQKMESQLPGDSDDYYDEEDDDEEESSDLKLTDELSDNGSGEEETKDESEDEKDEDENEDEKDEDENKVNDNSGGDEFDEEDIKSHTDESFREREKELLSDDQRTHIYANIPKVNLQNVIVPYKKIIEKLKTTNTNCKQYGKDFLLDYDGNIETYRFTDFRNKSNKVVSYLVKEFELRKNAQQMKKASVSKTGDLDMKNIHKYMFSEDIFRRVTNVPNGKSHGIVMFIDWSGSMGDHMQDTIKQLLNLVLFCRKVSIPFEVYAFSDEDGMNSYSLVEDDLKPQNFHLFNFFSSKMSTNELNYMANALLKMSSGGYYSSSYPDFLKLNGTPLNEAVIAAMSIVPEFREKNKLQIVNTVFLTDGDGRYIDDVHKTFVHPDSNQKYVTGQNLISPYNSKITAVIRHKQTGIFEKVTHPKGRVSYRLMTNALLKILKKVTNTNVVGFYLLSTREAKSYLYNNTSNDYLVENLYADFRRDKSIVIKSEGYDEYYLMKADTKLDEAEEIVAKSTTTRGFVNAFTKYNSTRYNNRIILNKFIGLIS